VKLKLLLKEQIPQIIELEKHSAPDKPYYSRYDQEALDFLFDNPEKCGAIGLFRGKNLIGWGAYRANWKRHIKEKGLYEVSSIVVDKDHRRRGFGKMILTEILKILQKSEAQRVFLTVSPLNIGALLLYLKNGFTIYDFRKNIYGPGGNRVYLELDLSEEK
jgi:ribosomal protein S18 acetylase RimI-like enzyme